MKGRISSLDEVLRPHGVTFYVKCGTSEFIKEFYWNILTCEVLKIFYTSILEACGWDDSSQNVCQNFWPWHRKPDKTFYMFTAQCTSRHLSRPAIRLILKEETVCVPSASGLVLMSLQKRCFPSCSRSTLYLPFSPAVSLESLAYSQNAYTSCKQRAGYYSWR